MKIMSRASENHKVHYNPRTVTKPPEELQRLIFPFIDKLNISLNALDASDISTTSCVSLELMERGITVMLHDVSQLVNIGRTHILFYHKVFKAELFLNCKETLVNFCSTSVNPVSWSLNDVIT